MIFRKKQKIFCIGRNKTGLTSLGHVMETVGYKLGKQGKSELLLEDWAKRDFTSIIEHCKSADAFKDVPFSLDYTYQILDHEFPGSRFILTVRGSAEEWYESLLRFDTKAVGKNRLPTAEDLKAYSYRRTGWLWQLQELVYGINENSLYNKEIYIRHYENYNKDVINYFRHRGDDLLVINISETNAMKTLCEFLNIEQNRFDMPHLNKSV